MFLERLLSETRNTSNIPTLKVVNFRVEKKNQLNQDEPIRFDTKEFYRLHNSVCCNLYHQSRRNQPGQRIQSNVIFIAYREASRLYAGFDDRKSKRSKHVSRP